jgi:hypothetical protein
VGSCKQERRGYTIHAWGAASKRGGGIQYTRGELQAREEGVYNTRVGSCERCARCGGAVVGPADSSILLLLHAPSSRCHYEGTSPAVGLTHSSILPPLLRAGGGGGGGVRWEGWAPPTDSPSDCLSLLLCRSVAAVAALGPAAHLVAADVAAAAAASTLFTHLLTTAGTDPREPLHRSGFGIHIEFEGVTLWDSHD